jgi:microcompartment protein CcmK/EutM
MLLARILGPVVSTAKHPALAAHTLLVCQPVDEAGQPSGAQIVAVDHAQAGEGDLVLVMREGNGVRQILGQKGAPIRSVIVGIVDEVQAEARG